MNDTDWEAQDVTLDGETMALLADYWHNKDFDRIIDVMTRVCAAAGFTPGADPTESPEYRAFMAEQAVIDAERRAQISAGHLAGSSILLGIEITSVGGPMLIINSVRPDIVATTDGGPVIPTWHTEADGPIDEDWVYYERFGRTGDRLAHGYVDPISRKIVQTG